MNKNREYSDQSISQQIIHEKKTLQDNKYKINNHHSDIKVSKIVISGIMHYKISRTTK